MQDIEIAAMLIRNGEEISALLFCQDENIPYPVFERILRGLNPESKLLH